MAKEQYRLNIETRSTEGYKEKENGNCQCVFF